MLATVILALVILGVFAAAMLHAALTDLMSMTIANRVSLALVGCFIILAPLAGMPLPGVALHLAAGFGVLVVTFAMFSFGAMGGGDAKLIAATAVWTGLGAPLVSYLFASAIIGGVFAGMILVYRRSALADATGHHALLRNVADRAKGIPYGVALGLGALVSIAEIPLTGWALAVLQQ